jgi:hypothetical protein
MAYAVNCKIALMIDKLCQMAAIANLSIADDWVKMPFP